MTFCEKEKTLIYGGYTIVDNRFLLNYLADAPDVCVKTYLTGLALCDSQGSDNSLQTIAQKLSITTDDVITAYRYWEELGLVHIINDLPPRVVYLEVRDSASALKKIKPSKYSKFSKEMQIILEGRMITVNEYNEYYLFLENTTFEPEALLAVAKYCVALKGNDIKYQYILTVARNEIKRGATTLATVAEHLNCQQKYDEDLKPIFKALGLSRRFEHLDREMYDKWVRELGFTQDVIVQVSKNCKTGGMTKLDALLCEYYKRGAMSVKEIAAYEEEKTRLYDLARAINKTIGVYYQSLDMIVDEYIVNWLNKGFEDETLLAIAKYCFRSGTRTLNGLASVIDKLYKNGITTLRALDKYLLAIAEKDAVIKNVLIKCGLDRKVTSNDRLLYKTWTENWQISADAVEYAAEKAAGANAPMAYVNRILSDYKQHGILTLTQAKNYKAAQTQTTATAAKVLVGGRDMERRQYTDEEINALFTALDETED
ncbi:MAG: DnaD domain protein [Firmicutes bacterium]|nr:DnaD domain protein [Bacillota bacterium]